MLRPRPKFEETAKIKDIPPVSHRVEPMTNAEKEELIRRVRAMDYEELEIVAANIPVQMCLDRIKKELEKAADLVNTVNQFTAKIGG